MVRKIMIVVDSRANWTRCQSLCEEVMARDDLELQLVVCGPMANNPEEWIDLTMLQESLVDSFPATSMGRYQGQAEGTPLEMSGLVGDLITDLTHTYIDNHPDIVVALTDRYETLAVAVSAALSQIHLAHIQGGEVTGSIDESIRHAVTKLSHVHFPATQEDVTGWSEPRRNGLR